MATKNRDAANLAASDSINEEVMQKIFNISPVETIFCNGAGTTTAKNQYTEWMIDILGGRDFGNAVVDGDDAGTDQSTSTSRVGNHCQISDKVLRVSGRARKVDTIGRSDELAYQLLQRGKELRLDIEAIALGNQGSVADNGNQTAGKAGTVPSWMTTNTNRGTGGADGGFKAGNVVIPTVGTARALKESDLRSVIQSCYTAGGDPSDVMVRPAMKQKISEFLFTTSARIGTITTETGQSTGQSVAVGAIDVFVSDFGVLKIMPNRQMLDYNDQGGYGASDISDVFIFDMTYWSMSYLRGYRTEVLSKAGDADNRQMLVDWTVCSKNEAASGIIADIDESEEMVV